MTKRIGNVVILETEPNDICEVCGVKDELRPYGRFNTDKKRRLKICFDCMKKDEKEAEKAFEEFLK